jgi:acetyl esterase/lipase
MVRRRWAAAAVTAVTAVLAGGATAEAGAAKRQATCSVVGPRTIAYRTIPSVAANLTSLDLYLPRGACRAGRGRVPVVVWVHGGGYAVGDKSQQVAAKVRLFTATRGWIFVSVNYRLSRAGDPSSARFPDHYDDVATAIAWLRRHIAARRGDPSRIALLGHSAGADIVSNVAVNPRYLAAHGQPLTALRCFAPLDTAGFDKARASAQEQRQWRIALGNEPTYVTSTSATLLVRAGIGIPRALTVFRGTPGRIAIEQGFAAALRRVGVPATLVDATTLTHNQVNQRIGAPGDTVMTPPLLRFLTGCFARR